MCGQAREFESVASTQLSDRRPESRRHREMKDERASAYAMPDVMCTTTNMPAARSELVRIRKELLNGCCDVRVIIEIAIWFVFDRERFLEQHLSVFISIAQLGVDRVPTCVCS